MLNSIRGSGSMVARKGLRRWSREMATRGEQRLRFSSTMRGGRTDEGLGGRERLNTKDFQLTEEQSQEVEKIIHPDMGQNKLDKYAYSIEMSESGTGARKVNIRGVGSGGFFINNFFVEGSVFLLENVTLSSTAKTIDDLKVEHFDLMDMLDPPLDLIVVGTGEKTEQLQPELAAAIRKIAPLEVCSSFHACATFNLMNAEDRRVGAIILGVEDSDEE